MVKFYISNSYMGEDVAHLCERKNENGTYDRIFITRFGSHTKIRTATEVPSPMRKDLSDFEPSTGEEFIKAYADVTTSFQRLTSSLFITFSNQHGK